MTPVSTDLIVRRLIRASAERLFDAWTEPEQLCQWWGPRSVTCVGAELDLRVGGTYRIGNQLPDGKVLWVFGEFECVERPNRLIYTWRKEEGGETPERVTVRFEPKGEITEVIVLHERISDPAIRSSHEKGWHGCLDSLAVYVGEASRR